MRRIAIAAVLLAASLAVVEARREPPRKPHAQWGVVLESECDHCLNECIRMGREKIWPDDGGIVK